MLYHASSKLRGLTRVHHDARLTFSSSAVFFARRTPLLPVGERLAGRRPRGNQDEPEGNESNADRNEEEEELDRWLLAGEEKVNKSEIRSYKDPYGHFRKTVAPTFREPGPRKWLGREVPFPLNPSFKPPIPLSDDLRTRLYKSYMIDPEINSVRKLAARHNIGIKRVDAILRLKGMEASWKKNKPLQTGFTKGMEHLLGVKKETMLAEQDPFEEDTYTGESLRPESRDRYDVEEADSQDEAEGNNRARQRYQRLFWESVAEGDEPVMPGLLETRGGAAASRAKFKGDSRLVERGAGRPAIMFVDVGDAFVDAKEKERREREGARRSALKARKRHV